MKYLTFKNIYNRLKAESPTFFKRLGIICTTILAIGLAIITLKEQNPNSMLWLNDAIGGYLITIGTVGGLVAKMTVTKVEKEDNNIK